MPCILKAKTKTSPGIISFTNNEVLSDAFNEKTVQDFLITLSKTNQYLFGVHIQGQLSWVKSWPQALWEDFFLWPVPKDLVAMGIPAEKIFPINCIQFMPVPPKVSAEKPYDLCIITRASQIKQVKEILTILREMFHLKRDLKVVFIMPDSRKLEFGNDAYEKQSIERAAFELPRELFTASELKRINFISSSTEAFGNFPLSSELIYDLLAKSKFSLSYSLMEGTPRAWIESFQVGTPIMIHEDVQSGLFSQLNDKNTVYLSRDIKKAAIQAVQAINDAGKFLVDVKSVNEEFCESYHLDQLKELLSRLIEARGLPVDGTWYLEDLNFRLPCHGEKYNGQIMNQSKFLFDWFKRIEEVEDPSEESDTFGFIGFNDEKVFSPIAQVSQLKTRVIRKLKRTFS